MRIVVVRDYAELSKRAAAFISGAVRKKPNLVLGLASGSTPLGTYAELVRRHREEGLDFSQVVAFGLDEYIGLSPDHPRSFDHFLHRNFFDDVNIKTENIHMPDDDYESQIQGAGGIDLQILGIGTNGPLGFNEPGSSFDSRTRIAALTVVTIEKNGAPSDRGITMGIATILECKQILLLASGSDKASAIAKCVDGPISVSTPASVLRSHADTVLIADEQAAGGITAE